VNRGWIGPPLAVRILEPVTSSDNPRVSATSRTPFTGVIALDGPSGTGKSTVARRLAAELGARYLDTGAMYRAATVAALRGGVDLDDNVAITDVVESAKIEISTDPDDVSITLDGEPVDAEIRAAETTAAVSAVSAVPAVRALLVAAQRELIADGGIVVEGRDIGTTVCPEAPVKIFLTAAVDTRASRRARQVAVDAEPHADGLSNVRADLQRRDHLDSSRAASPLLQAADAVALDTTTMDAEQVVAAVLALVRERTGVVPVGTAALGSVGGDR
jgi:CMP/dCMP kinase